MPIVSLGNLLSFFVSFIVAIKLYLVYRKTKSRQVGNFFKFAASTSLLFLFISAPGTFTQDPFLMGVFNLFGALLVIVSGMFFAILVFELFNLEKIKRVYIIFIVLAIIAVFVLRISAPIPLEKVTEKGFVFWLRPDDALIKASFLISGLIVFLSTVGGSLAFLSYGFKKRENKFTFHRSLLIGGGMLLLAIAVGINFILGATPDPVIYITACILASISLFIVLFGILYKKENA